MSDQYIVTAPVRIAFPHLFEPKAKSEDKPDLKVYQVVLLIPPTADMAPYHAAIEAAIKAQWGKAPPKWRSPLLDAGGKSHLDGYVEGWTYINTQRTRRPGVVDRLGQPIADPELVWGGQWAKAYINAFAWANKTGGKGVSFGLNGIQIVKDDTRFGAGQVDVTKVFKPLDEDDLSDLF